MSRIGKKPIILPAKVEVKIADKLVTIKGPKGTLEQLMPAEVSAETQGQEILVKVNNSETKKERALWGLFRSLINNMVEGVVKGFSKQLEINGIGFKAQVQGGNLILNVGFSHPVTYVIAKDITISVEKNIITVNGIDKQRVGQVAAEIRAIKKPEPYKGKGIKYINEVIRRKAGKSVKGATGK
jgi:large subunit ribosomal protein L6